MFKTDRLTKTDAYARTPGHGPFTPNEDKEWAWLCDVCRSTMAGNTYLYPRNYEHGTALVMQMLAWGINEIKRTVVPSDG